MSKYELITRKVEAIVEPLILKLQCELIEVLVRDEVDGLVIRVYLDKDSGVTIDDCVHINRELGEILETEDFITRKYQLEVCSPGIDRNLSTHADFQRVQGKILKVVTVGIIGKSPVNVGKLINCGDSSIYLELEDKSLLEIPLDIIKKATLDIKN